MIKEEGLRDWFGKSKSRMVNWLGECCNGWNLASDEPGEGTPKCVSSSKGSMSKKERLSAQRRRNVLLDNSPRVVIVNQPMSLLMTEKMKEETVIEATDKKGKGSGSKDARTIKSSLVILLCGLCHSGAR